MNRRMTDNTMPYMRLIVCVYALVAWYNSLVDPGSRLYKVAMYSDGSNLLWIMALMAAITLTDTIINDWTPDSITAFGKTINLNWKRVLIKRHYVLILMGGCYWAQPFVAERGSRPVESVAYFLWAGMACMIVAVLDAKQRSRDLECLKTDR